MISMDQINNCIESGISRLSGEDGVVVSHYYLDLRVDGRQRITDKYVGECIALCESRGLDATRSGDSLIVTVNLWNCYLTPDQANRFNFALAHTRSAHGNHI